MNDASKAVFLSYASQDADAARRICEALRTTGVEVWFDQSELVGGDQWDQKIRKQIKDCALLIPVISAATQARTEGYFRLEWRLADQRTHLMAKGRPFLLPVVIDGTRDDDAQVPDSFTEVQWTRLPGGETSSAFGARVRKLLGQDVAGVADSGPKPASARPATIKPSRLRTGWVVGILTVVTVGAVAIWRPWKSSDSVLLTPGSLPALSTSNEPPATVSLSDARKLVAKAWEQLNKTARSRAELEMADRLCQQAAELDPNDADVWAAWSQVDIWYYYTNVERTIARKEGASSKAARALRIAPDSYEARLAQACFFVREEPHEKSIFADEAERQLRRLLEERADEPRALFALGILLRNGLRHDEGALVFDRLARQPDFAATALSEKGFLRLFQGRFQEAGECADQSIAFEPFWGNLALKTFVAVDWYGDLDQARDAVERMPAAALMEDYGAGAAYDVYWRRREPDKMLRVLRAVPREWLSSNNLSGPKQFYVGVAHQMAGRPDAARTEWRTALEMLNLRLQTDPNNSEWHFVKAKLLVWLGGNKTEAEEQFRLAQDFAPDDWQKFGVAVERAILSGDVDGAIRVLEQSVKDGLRRVTAAALKTSPMYDPIQADPRFQALLARVEADPRLSPKAKQKTENGSNRSDSDLLATRSSLLATPQDKSVAVLPFANLSDDKGNEYFSDGISEELLDVLAKIPGLRVAARTSSFSFKGKSATAQEIGEKLGVATLVEGSVRKSGNSVRISARLSRAQTGEQLWSESYTRDLQDVFAVQSELARTIIEQLRGRLGDVVAAAEVKAAVRGGTSNPEAHQQYLQGRYQLNQFSMESFEKALTHFEKATTIDPTFALGWAALSRTRVMQTGLASNVTRPQFEAALNEARRAADRALELEPDLPETLNARFEIQFFDFDWKGGAKTMNRALALAPSDAVQLNAASRVAAVFRDHERAVEIARQAVVVDPVNPEVRSNLAAFLLQVRRPVEARAEYLRVAELNPATPWAFAGVGVTYLLEGKYIEAIAASERESAAWAKSLVSAIGLWGLHRTAEADAALNEMIKVSADTGAYQISQVFSFRGDKDQAFAWLDRARRQLDGGLAYYTNDPFLDNLRSDPRWAAFQRTMGWADDQLK